MLLHSSRPAMATLFEAWLVGDDEEHLRAVAEAAFDEVTRLDRLLSRFDPAAEIARINREASHHPVRIDRELFAILADCLKWSHRTGGCFDIAAPSRAHADRPLRLGQPFSLDPERGTVSFSDASVFLDLGGYGKGCALDAAARVLDEFGIGSALLHGGTSSVLVKGRPPGEPGWRAGLRDPFGATAELEIVQLCLTDCALSSSAAFDTGASTSDLIDPDSGRPLSQPAACTAIAPSASAAEALSTALLVMGRKRAERFLATERSSWADPPRAAWIERQGDRTVVDWLEPISGSCSSRPGTANDLPQKTP